eukprot:CAMPEP_0195539888 /NCGR_PEP_ID=MMETSP0794_2-20130614/50293_1 /TAXON_ID=515487 /ORGANISM="Stephanopyxis turris, Strain CCMP 815" /LENGTH=350 /DNA_ID=CAMNT_0040673947 /DNA_START=55 /DNA_END=1107 /DNA_ORIENTATION=-
MTFGWSGQTSSIVDEAVAGSMLEKFIDHTPHSDMVHIDTARIYAGGKTEHILGSAMRQIDNGKTTSTTIGTKAHPSQPGGLSAEGIQNQLKESLSAMDIKSVGEFYLHQPDTEHSLLESLRAAHDLKTQGLIQGIGMSNYHASEMKRAFRLCEEHNLTKPTVFQGLYNPLNRMVEKELLPVLKENGCSFVAYNPLAAGLLTGKHSRPSSEEGIGGGDEVKDGRFKNNQNYLPRFYTSTNFEALEAIRDACEASGLSMVEATFRWILCHSALGDNDGILLGASSIGQLEDNLSACGKATTEDLPEPVLKALNDAWHVTSDGAFPYWRSYSSDMPGGEDLDQGASYSASKTN